jgi:hypothetical protein
MEWETGSLVGLNWSQNEVECDKHWETHGPARFRLGEQTPAFGAQKWEQRERMDWRRTENFIIE